MAMNELYERAVRAWNRYGERHGLIPTQPSSGASEEITTEDGREYVVLANSYRLLAVYRVCPNERLRKITRVPQEIQAFYS